MNGPVRAVRGERIYPITAMGSHTAGGIVDVEGWCRDHNMTPVALMINGVADQNGNLVGNIDLCPIGQDESHHYVLPFFAVMIYDIAVRKIWTANTTATDVFILGINP
jgi:hypothetical protein